MNHLKKHVSFDSTFPFLFPKAEVGDICTTLSKLCLMFDLQLICKPFCQASYPTLVYLCFADLLSSLCELMTQIVINTFFCSKFSTLQKKNGHTVFQSAQPSVTMSLSNIKSTHSFVLKQLHYDTKKKDKNSFKFPHAILTVL